MKRLILVFSLFALALAGTAQAGYIEAPIEAMLYRADGAVCQSSNGCRMYVQRERSGSTWSVATGSSHYCGAGGGAYWHFQYGQTTCGALPFYENALKYVTSAYDGSSEYFKIWMQQPCAGGGFHISASRRIFVPYYLLLPIYGGALRPGSACS